MKFLTPLLSVALVSLLGILGAPGCSKGGSYVENPGVYFSTMTNLTVEVAYEPGAEPYTGNLPNSQSIWTILEQNLAALFQGRTTVPTFTVPHDTASMTALAAQNQTTWTLDEIRSLATAQRKGTSSSTHTYFFVVFLKGYLDDNGSANQNVIGVSLTGTTIIAMFKEVIQSTGGALAVVPKFVEQATLVHELGHGLGLVDNGVPMKTSHKDTDSSHGAHCSNTDCVMYYLNEGKSDLANFIQNYLATSSYVMFDDKCLDDTRSYKP